jgi:hypothetical protein
LVAIQITQNIQQKQHTTNIFSLSQSNQVYIRGDDTMSHEDRNNNVENDTDESSEDEDFLGNNILGNALMDNNPKLNGYDEQKMLDLISQYSDEIQVVNNRGQYPLHIAVCCNHTIKVVRKLLWLFPQAAVEKDYYGDYPLHAVVQSRCTRNKEDAVLLLCKKFPRTVAEKGSRSGIYPIEFAMWYLYSNESILELLKLFPSISIAPGNSQWS